LERLKPATNIEFRNELTACLVLVAPVGMTEEARGEWLRVAWETLKHLPADLLGIGCRKARETCDHPSKIVPAILAETRDLLERRRDHVRASYTPPARQLPPPDVCTPEAAAAILAEMGLSSAAEQTVKRCFGTPRWPTKADYIALGVDPSVLTTSTSNE
jgi:hypothetical protein